MKTKSFQLPTSPVSLPYDHISLLSKKLLVTYAELTAAKNAFLKDAEAWLRFTTRDQTSPISQLNAGGNNRFFERMKRDVLLLNSSWLPTAHFETVNADGTPTVSSISLFVLGVVETVYDGKVALVYNCYTPLKNHYVHVKVPAALAPHPTLEIK